MFLQKAVLWDAVSYTHLDVYKRQEGLQIKGKNAYSNLNLTIEGIGEDAGIHGFGMLIRNAGNVELRNFAVMACLDDSVSLDTSNCNVRCV